MTDHFTDFPFEEIRDRDGNLFLTIDDAMMETRLGENHIWSIVESDGTWTYGPWRHRVNLVGYIATREPHDNDTYYHEKEDFDLEQGEV